MRWTLVLLALLVMCALTPAQAQQTPQTGLYIDDTRGEHCEYGTADYYPIDIYAWVRPGENGMRSMSAQILYPDIVIPAYQVLNEAIVLERWGTPQDGIHVIFEECQYDEWVWGFYQTVLCISTEPGLVQLYPIARDLYHERIGFGISNCLSYPEITQESSEPVSNVCINFCADDVTPPRIEELLVVDHSTLEITFTEEVTAESAEDTANYLIYSRYGTFYRGDSICPVSAELYPGDTTAVLVFAEPFVCHTDKIFRSSRIADTVGNMWELIEPFSITSSYVDLIVSELTAIDTITGCEDSIVVSCTVMNIGVCSTQQASVKLAYIRQTEHGDYLGSTDIGYMAFGGLEAGETATVEFNWTPGYYQNETLSSHGKFLAVVDTYLEVEESDESNNHYSFPVVVLPPRDFFFYLRGDSVRAGFESSALDRTYIDEPVTSYEILWSDSWQGEFEKVAVVAADGSPAYVCGFPMTTYRSYSVVFVRAVRPVGGTTYYYETCPEWELTGADLPPSAPQGFTATSVDGDMLLEWDANVEEDLSFYVLEWTYTGHFPPVSDPPGYPSGQFVSDTLFTHEGWDPGDEVLYRLCAVDTAGNCGDFAFVASWPYSTDDSVVMPQLQLTLYQNHPNPFNPATTISFYLPERCAVRLEVFDVSGRRAAVLIDESMDKGAHAAEWNGKDENGTATASGVYFYRLTAGRKTISKKMILLR